MVKMVVQRWQRQEATDAETMLDAGLAMAWSLDEVEKTVICGTMGLLSASLQANSEAESGQQTPLTQ